MEASAGGLGDEDLLVLLEDLRIDLDDIDDAGDFDVFVGGNIA